MENEQPAADATEEVERRRNNWNQRAEDRLADMHQQNTNRFELIEKRQAEFYIDLKKNTEATERIESAIGTLVDVISGGRKSIRFGIKLGQFLSAFARFALPIINVAAALWLLAHGRLPWKD
jgi:sigma54-dependent transcription regulator